MSDLTFTNGYSGFQGAFMNLDSSMISQVTFARCAFTGFFAASDGGVFSVQSTFTKKISLDTVTAETVTAPTKGSFMYSSAAMEELSMSGSTIQCIKTLSANDINTLLNNDTVTKDRAGLFYMDSAQSIVGNSNTLSQCYVAIEGAAWYLKNTAFVDTDSTYEFNYAETGGAIVCQDCSMSLTRGVY